MKACSLGVAVLLLGACGAGWGAPVQVASFSTITSDIARNVGGRDITLVPIVGPGIDPHEFQPSPSDVRQVGESDVVLLTGKGMEGYLTKLKESAPKAVFVDCGAPFPSLRMEEEGRSIEDPHWWHSIANMRIATGVVRDALVHADPAHAAGYAARAETYLAGLNALETWTRETIATLPREKRKLVTSHDAFQYFARDYGFTLHAIEGVSTEDEPSSKKVAELIGIIRSERVKAVFFENIENPKVITAITRETGAKIGGELYADGLGDREARTYTEMVKHNVTTLVDSLK